MMEDSFSPFQEFQAAVPAISPVTKENIFTTPPGPSVVRKIEHDSDEKITTPKVQFQSNRLPKKCPLPASFTPSVCKSFQNNEIRGNVKLTLIREACEFYYGICPNPNAAEYQIMAQTLCDKYPELKNKLPVNGAYWVKLIIYIIITFLIYFSFPFKVHDSQTNESKVS